MSISEKLKTEAANQQEEARETIGSEQPTQEAPKTFRLSDGTEITAEEVEKGYLRQQDYTRKTQSLSEEKKKLQSEYQDALEFSNKMGAYFEANPEAYNEVAQFFQTGSISQRKPAEPVENKEEKPETGKEESAMEQPQKPLRNYEYDQRIAEIEKRQRQAEVDKAAVRLMRETSISDDDLDSVIEYATENFIKGKGYYENLKNAYEVIEFRKYRETQEQAEKRRREKEEAQFMGGTASDGKRKKLTEGQAVMSSLLKGQSREIL